MLWFTGLSGSGKSTVAEALARRLNQRKVPHIVLDGDVIRQGLCSDLGFSAADRTENLRRVAEVARLFARSGLVCVVAFISPFRTARARARRIIGRDQFREIHFCASLSACEQRDCKGLYAKARAGGIPEFTGITSPYEPPRRPALSLDTTRLTTPQCVARLERLLAD